MERAMRETDRRRAIQTAYNEANNITPQSIIKPIDMSLIAVAEGDYVTVPLEVGPEPGTDLTPEDRDALIAEMETKMRQAAKAFDFEKAAQFRDRMKALKASGVYEEATATRPGGGG
jgi:excinuclease ABC subunit B